MRETLFGDFAAFCLSRFVREVTDDVGVAFVLRDEPAFRFGVVFRDGPACTTGGGCATWTGSLPVLDRVFTNT